MNKHVPFLLIVASALSGCGAVSLVPPADVPGIQSSTAAPAPVWRPYSSGPLQAASPGISSGSGKAWPDRPSQTRADAVSRRSLPSAGASSVDNKGQVAAPLATSGASEWKPYSSARQAPEKLPGKSVFGSGVTSSWAVAYVPESLRIEFGIFAAKAARDGQARMVTPTGQVYSASVVERAASCTTVEIGVTEGGDLPIIARGSARVCR